MSYESHDTHSSTVVDINPHETSLTETDMTINSDPLTEETKALVAAVRTRAEVDAQSAGDFTREAYLNTVRQLRETVEQNKLFDPDQIEQSIATAQQEAEKNWNVFVKEVTDFGDRLSEASKAAWDIMTQPKE